MYTELVLRVGLQVELNVFNCSNEKRVPTISKHAVWNKWNLVLCGESLVVCLNEGGWEGGRNCSGVFELLVGRWRGHGGTDRDAAGV